MSLAYSLTLAALGIDPEPSAPCTRQQELPEDVEWLAGRQGIDVACYPFRSSRIAGLLIQEKGGSYCIGINSRMVVARQLFSLAHELGHYALYRHCSRPSSATPDGRTSWSARPTLMPCSC